MKKIFAIALTFIATIIGTTATSGCIWVFLNEPEMPESLD